MCSCGGGSGTGCTTAWCASVRLRPHRGHVGAARRRDGDGSAEDLRVRQLDAAGLALRAHPALSRPQGHAALHQRRARALGLRQAKGETRDIYVSFAINPTRP